MFKNMFNNKKVIIIFIAIILGLAVSFVAVFLSKEIKTEEVLPEAKRMEIDSVKEHAEKEGYTQYFLFRGQWYANVGGKWVEAENSEEARIMNYASRNGYNRYFILQGQWYANVGGKWVEAENSEEAKSVSTTIE